MRGLKRGLAAAVLAASAVGLALAPASAQLAKFTISPDAAKKLGSRNELSYDTARKIADVCFDFAKEHNIALTVAIYDAFGEPILVQRMDGQGKTNIETAILKAKTVINTRRSSHIDMNRVLQGQASEFHGAYFNGVFANKGALPVFIDGEFLGAVGVGGSNMDEECAQAGMEKVLGQQIKLEPNVNIPRGRAGAG